MDSSPACEQNCCGTEHEPRRGDPMIQHTITLCNERCFLQWGEETTRLLLSISLGPLRLGQGSRRKHGHQPGGQSASCTTNFFLSHSRSSGEALSVIEIYYSRRNGKKSPDTCKTRKQANTNTTNKKAKPNTNTTKHRPAASVRGRVKQMVKRR